MAKEQPDNADAGTPRQESLEADVDQHFKDLLEASSLGTPAARRIRASSSDDIVDDVRQRLMTNKEQAGGRPRPTTDTRAGFPSSGVPGNAVEGPGRCPGPHDTGLPSRAAARTAGGQRDHGRYDPLSTPRIKSYGTASFALIVDGTRSFRRGAYSLAGSLRKLLADLADHAARTIRNCLTADRIRAIRALPAAFPDAITVRNPVIARLSGRWILRQPPLLANSLAARAAARLRWAIGGPVPSPVLLAGARLQHARTVNCALRAGDDRSREELLLACLDELRHSAGDDARQASGLLAGTGKDGPPANSASTPGGNHVLPPAPRPVLPGKTARMTEDQVLPATGLPGRILRAGRRPGINPAAYPEEITQFCLQEASPLQAYLRRMGIPSEEIDDLTQESFTAVITMWRQIRDPRRHLYLHAHHAIVTRQYEVPGQPAAVAHPDPVPDHNGLPHSDSELEDLIRRVMLLLGNDPKAAEIETFALQRRQHEQRLKEMQQRMSHMQDQFQNQLARQRLELIRAQSIQHTAIETEKLGKTTGADASEIATVFAGAAGEQSLAETTPALNTERERRRERKAEDERRRKTWDRLCARYERELNRERTQMQDEMEVTRLKAQADVLASAISRGLADHRDIEHVISAFNGMVKSPESVSADSSQPESQVQPDQDFNRSADVPGGSGEEPADSQLGDDQGIVDAQVVPGDLGSDEDDIDGGLREEDLGR